MQLSTHFSGSLHARQHTLQAAKLLLESVCKHILDDLGVLYERNINLDRLYRLAAACLRLGTDARQERLVQLILQHNRPAPVRATSIPPTLLSAAGNMGLAANGLPGFRLQEPLSRGAGSLANYLLQKHLEAK
jgi:hypothetical protein